MKKSEKVLLSGNEALAEGALQAGCRCYFGYPITPQSEIPAYMVRRMKEVGGVFLQAESEIAAINMVYGAAATGARAMTSSSGPGISLKQEGLSYLAGAELPAVIVNVMRGGPGLGNIAPSQSDYFQATRGGGHGDYHLIVLAPNSVQEMLDLAYLAFELADKYRNPVMILADAILGQMMEGVEFKEENKGVKKKDWIIGGDKGRKPNIIRSLFLEEGVLEEHNKKLQEKYARIRRLEVKYESMQTDDAELLLVSYGSMARLASEVVTRLRRKGIKAGLLRPITLWPFPYSPIRKLTDRVRFFFVVEMSEGQMLEDVKLAVEGAVPVYFYGRLGGGVPTPLEVMERIEEKVGDEDRR
ncbi:3-methyl-2-oxobutanoate dehydrogenase subunit VorB [Candidatus Aerophobetes bacterium]|uniref:3-methyl-2-oxobutanoate dehydrogenase subunit VorB n=1 Tax=Aerophobetes bacterium TaxID=2030807 RepID=A0A523YR04_UNCAE|nr:MAG: 3-methyl-2-oxobutanoate dehydrogenase subunit VorB [Candidatus Aerophobetes bacterium]